MSLIEVEHLRKEYPGVVPLKDVNATVERGEVISIIGPSGTGKSTFLRCINLLETPTSALDPTMVPEVLTVMKNLASRGLTMLVVTHEMRFAREASTRVFYMDRGELWESGPPEQIFKNSKRQETHDFIFRVRSWEWEINAIEYDYPAMIALIQTFCARQFLGRRIAMACELVIEEITSRFLIPQPAGTT